MLKDITLGQFFPGNSLIHRLDPRIKIILTVLYITAVFIVKNFVGFALIFAVSLAVVLLSKISLKVILKSFKPLLFIIAFTAVINIFWTKGDTLIFKFHFVEIYLDGILFALAMILRVMLLLTATTVFLTYTTSPIALTDALERLFSPLKKIKVPVHEFAMMMTIALRFIPTLIEETDKIMSAQKARGADFSSGGLIARAKSLIPILIPLFVSSFRRADELAIAMESRLYRGDIGRTRMTSLHTRATDYIFLFLALILIAAVILINVFLPAFAI